MLLGYFKLFEKSDFLCEKGHRVPVPLAITKTVLSKHEAVSFIRIATYFPYHLLHKAPHLMMTLSDFWLDFRESENWLVVKNLLLVIPVS